MKVLMRPMTSDFHEESGIKRVCEAYERYLPEYGIEFVDDDRKSFDVLAIHAGVVRVKSYSGAQVAHLHGLYWTADYDAVRWEWSANMSVVESARAANVITVPSEWVAETIRRDMRVDPVIIPHGIEWDEWQHSYDNQGYVLFNKNRDADVCDPYYVGVLAKKFPKIRFASTFPPHETDDIHNLIPLGLLSHDKMKEIVQKAAVYLSTTKETFGIGTLEALAAGVPVLGFDFGGNSDIVTHGYNGYLAMPGNENDLAQGLIYCLKYRKALSANARESAKRWTWDRACELVASTYERALNINSQPPDVSVILITMRQK